jgi:hypothetical protein
VDVNSFDSCLVIAPPDVAVELEVVGEVAVLGENIGELALSVVVSFFPRSRPNPLVQLWV